MNLKERNVDRRIVFCEVLSILLLVGLSAGWAWGENQLCSGCHHHFMPTLSNFEWTHGQSHPGRVFVKQPASSQNPAGEKISGKVLYPERGSGEREANRVRMTQILLIGTLVGGMLFLGRCLS